jgi:medium-chain acyl-[acyl-carrier-protein] hydrolase
MITMNAWVKVVPRSGVRLRLFCFPHSGAGALSFRSWQDNFPSEIDICPVQLPGRENRFRDKPYEHMAPLVKAATDALMPYLDQPFALYGHSLGSLVAFEIARRLRIQGARQPEHLFVSGCHAPQLPPATAPISQLNDKAFLTEVERFGGISKELLQNTEFITMVLPILRADLSIYDTYAYTVAPPLDLPISAYGGSQDARAPEALLAAWRKQTNSQFSLQMFPGGHFFLQSDQKRFLATLTKSLLLYL